MQCGLSCWVSWMIRVGQIVYLSDLYSLMSLISMPINMSVTQGIAILIKLSQNQYTINRLNSMKDTHIGHKFFPFFVSCGSHVLYGYSFQYSD